MKKTCTAFASLLAALTISSSASAAFIFIDDSDINNITITAGDFEEGFFVDGNLLTLGLGDSNSITLADGGYSITGSWIDNGLAVDRLDMFFALPNDPAFATSGIEFGTGTDGFFASLSGSIGAFLNPSQYFSVAVPTSVQNGQTISGFMPFLDVSFTSEAPLDVPEPTALALFGLGIAGLRLARRSSTQR
jgi:hypothetical protein